MSDLLVLPTSLSSVLFCSESCRLEQEEQGRQKLQLEKVAVDGKLKKLEETVAVHEDTNNKVSIAECC